MMFTAEQQQEHRDEFIKDCWQKIWGAACNANWVGAQLDKLIALFDEPREGLIARRARLF